MSFAAGGKRSLVETQNSANHKKSDTQVNDLGAFSIYGKK